jgi:hypothetical protein
VEAIQSKETNQLIMDRGSMWQPRAYSLLPLLTTKGISKDLGPFQVRILFAFIM